MSFAPLALGIMQQKRSGRPFIIKVNYASGFTVTLPLYNSAGYNYNFIVDWGDGAVSQVTSATDANRIHTYASGGTYTIKMTGVLEGWIGDTNGMREYLIEVSQWGRTNFKIIRFSYYTSSTPCARLVACYGKLDTTSLVTTNFHSAFYSCTSLTTVECADWDMSRMTTFFRCFAQCTNLVNIDVSNWNVSSCTDFGSGNNGMFGHCSSLVSLDLSGWVFNSSANVSFNCVFLSCSKLTTVGDISNWNTNKFTSIALAFSGCAKLYQTNGTLDVSGWNLSNCTDLSYTFNGCVLLTEIDVTGWTLNTSANVSMASTFASCTALADITGIGGLNMSKVASLQQTFYNCSNLTYIDVSGWDTSTNTSLSRTFYGCVKINGLDVSGWNVTKVTDFGYGNGGCFGNCYALTELDCSAWVFSSTSNVRFSMVFSNCRVLTTVGDVSGWNTGKFTDMSGAFTGCWVLENLDVSGWDTSACTNFSAMFNACYAMTAIDVADWDVSVCTNFNLMFSSCTGLTSLDLYGWSFSASAVSMGSFMNNCPNVTTIDASSIGTGWTVKLSDLGLTFYGCSNLTNLDTSNWDLSACTSLYRTFRSCTSLGNIDVSGWDVSKVTNFGSGDAGTFAYCYAMTALDCSGWQFHTTSNFAFVRVFYSCTSLTTIGDISGWNMNKCTTMNGTFMGSAIAALDCSGWNVSSCTDFTSTFQQMTALASLDVSGWTLNSVSNINMTSMFAHCSALTSVNITSWTMTKVTTTTTMFYSMTELLTLYVPSTLLTVGNGFATGCNKITDLYMYPNIAPAVTGTPFTARGSSCILHVPSGSSSYNTSPWNSSTYFAQPITKDL